MSKRKRDDDVNGEGRGFTLDLRKLLDINSEWHKEPKLFRRADLEKLGGLGAHADRPADILEEIAALIPDGIGMDAGDGVKLREVRSVQL